MSLNTVLPAAPNTYTKAEWDDILRQLRITINQIHSGFVINSDYGVWTPALTCTTPGDLSITTSTALGRYTKLGRQVFLTFVYVTSAFTHTTASGTVSITGVPYTSENATGIKYVGPIAVSGWTKAGYTELNCYMENNATTMKLSASASGTALADMAIADFPTGGSVIIRGQLAYNS